jgi:hypothetical protein
MMNRYQNLLLISTSPLQPGNFKWALAAWAALAMAGRNFFAGLADQFVYGGTTESHHADLATIPTKVYPDLGVPAPAA